MFKQMLYWSSSLLVILQPSGESTMALNPIGEAFRFRSEHATFRSIECGQTIRDSIAAVGQQNTYTFEGNPGEAVIISAAAVLSGGLAAYVELYSPPPSNLFIGGNGFGNNSTSSVRLWDSGVYTIIVRDYNLNKTGAYDVSLQFTSGRCGMPLPCGETRSGNLAGRGQQDSYSFNAYSDEAVIVTAVASSSPASAYVALYDPSGAFLGANGFGNNSTSSHKLTTDGTYTVIVHDYNFQHAGAYDVNLQFTSGHCGVPIRSGQSRSDAVSSKAHQSSFSFCGRQGGSAKITAVATSGDLAAYAQVYDPEGSFLGANGFGNNSTSNLTLPATGTYTIIVRDYAFKHEGDYNVNLACLATSCDDPLPMLSRLSPDSIAAGGSGFTLVVEGSDFTATSIVRWNGKDRPTIFVNANQLQAAISASDIAAPGAADISVRNPAQSGGCVSNAKTVTILSGTVIACRATDRPSFSYLAQNYPNPFNPSTTIRYALPKSGFVTLKIYDLLGNEIASLVHEHKAAGEHEAQWHPSGAPSGVYVYRLRAGEHVETKKLVLVR